MNNQLLLSIQLNEEAKLPNFCWENNDLLRLQLQTTLEQEIATPLYLWGGVGSGKSYLLQACCQAISTSRTAIYLPLQILREMGPEIIEGLESQDLICIDDIDAIAARREWEEAIFHLYNQARDEGKRIIISGSCAPAFLPLQLPDLKSRMGGGLVFQLSELSDEKKIDILQKKASERGFHLSFAVSHYLLSRCSRNMHELQEVINKLDLASLREQRKITIPFAKSILQL